MPGDPALTPTDRLAGVEAGRGIACLLVVFYHAAVTIMPSPRYWHARVFHGGLDWGFAGVEFFFVLSGFIIATAHARDVARPAALGRFVYRRVVRIYPAYWLVLAGLLVVVAVGPAVDIKMGPAVVVRSILLFGGEARPTVLTVAWTLFHEIAFYAVFAVWIVSRPAGAIVSGAWLCLIVAALIVPESIDAPQYLASPINLLFAFGVAAWWVARKAEIARATALGVAAAATGVFVAIGLRGGPANDWVQQIEFGVAAAVGIAAIVIAERRRPLGVPRAMTLLGAASYSIYLTHFPLLSVFAKIGMRTGLRDATPEIAFVVVCAATVAAGIAFHLLVEKPLLTALLPKARRTPAAVGAPIDGIG